MISKQLTVTGYADGYYTVGEFTQPRWDSDGLTKPITGTTPRYAAGDAVVVPHKIVKELEELADAIYTGTEETSAHTRDWWPGTIPCAKASISTGGCAAWRARSAGSSTSATAPSLSRQLSNSRSGSATMREA